MRPTYDRAYYPRDAHPLTALTGSAQTASGEAVPSVTATAVIFVSMVPALSFISVVASTAVVLVIAPDLVRRQVSIPDSGLAIDHAITPVKILLVAWCSRVLGEVFMQVQVDDHPAGEPQPALRDADEELLVTDLNSGNGFELETTMWSPVALSPMIVSHMTLGIVEGFAVHTHRLSEDASAFSVVTASK